MECYLWPAITNVATVLTFVVISDKCNVSRMYYYVTKFPHNEYNNYTVTTTGATAPSTTTAATNNNYMLHIYYNCKQ
jgi:hypothetical protein